MAQRRREREDQGEARVIRRTKKAEAQYKRCLLTTIKSAAESRAQYWTAAAWLLERKYPMEYGKMERKADDSDNAPVQLTLGLVIEPMADDTDGEGGGSE